MKTPEELILLEEEAASSSRRTARAGALAMTLLSAGSAVLSLALAASSSTGRTHELNQNAEEALSVSSGLFAFLALLIRKSCRGSKARLIAALTVGVLLGLLVFGVTVLVDFDHHGPA